MAETIKKGVIKKKTDASNTVVLYPKTTIDQVENLETTLDSKQDSVKIYRYI